MCYTKTSTDFLDVIFKSSTVFIAAINLYYVIDIFKTKNKRDDIDKEKDRRINWLKTLVLDHNLKHFYDFFDRLEGELSQLKHAGLTDDQKATIDTNAGDLFIFLRRKFTDTLLSVDDSLYENVLKLTDQLQEHLTTSIFDSGINLNHIPKYDEIINEHLASTKTNILKIIFDYRG